MSKGSGKLLTQEQWDAFKAAGFTEAELLADQPFGPIIFSYTRAMAIADGVLVDLMQAETAPLVRQAGFCVAVAMTATAFEKSVCPIGQGNDSLPAGQSIKGRLWDVLTMLRHRIRTRRSNDALLEFTVSVDCGDNCRELVRLWCYSGPGDEGEHVLTITLEGED